MIEQYRTKLYAMLERLQGMQEHKRHKDAQPITVSTGAHLLKVQWLKTNGCWKVVSVKGLAAVRVAKFYGPQHVGARYLTDARACEIATDIIRAALNSDSGSN